MGSFITKEITELNGHLDKVIESNKERRRPQASSEMQLTMTSINNLALMLDDHFDMMMQMMANAQPSGKKSKQKGQKPSLSQMQQQLNKKIEELKNGGKSGRQLSEELAEMAGAKVSATVSRQTDIVVAGPGAGSKLSDARKFGIRVVDEAEFNALLRTSGVLS